AESVWLALAKSQLTLGNGPATAAAFGAAARGRFNHVRHVTIISTLLGQRTFRGAEVLPGILFPSTASTTGSLCEHFCFASARASDRYGVRDPCGHQLLPPAERHDAVAAAGDLPDSEGQLRPHVRPDRFHHVCVPGHSVVAAARD